MHAVDTMTMNMLVQSSLCLDSWKIYIVEQQFATEIIPQKQQQKQIALKQLSHKRVHSDVLESVETSILEE